MAKHGSSEHGPRERNARLTILECAIGFVHLPSVLQLVEHEMYTGRIVIEPGGFIALQSGRVVAAETDSGLVDADAIRELFLIEDAACRIELDEAVAGRPIASTIGITLDGCKLIDEWNAIARERITLRPNLSKLTPELKESVMAVCSVIEEMHAGATLEQAVERTLSSRSVIVSHLIRLIESEVVELNGTTPVLPLALRATDRYERPVSIDIPRKQEPPPLPKEYLQRLRARSRDVTLA